MENKCFKVALFLLFSVIFSSFVFSEEVDTPDSESLIERNYFVKEDEAGETTLIQRLSWEIMDDISGYEFILEHQDEKAGKWKELTKERLTDNFKDVTLKPGKYRFKVAIINLLDQLEEYSEYRNFDIKIAYQPKVFSVSPTLIHFDDIYPETFIVKGENLHNETTFSLVDLQKTDKKIRGEVVNILENNRAEIKFDMLLIEPSEYLFSVVDPSTLKDNTQKVVFKFQKPVDFYLSAGYVFNYFVNNETFSNYFRSNFAALSGVLRMSLMVIKRTYGAFGFNITGSIMPLKFEEENYTLKSIFLVNQFNISYILPIIRRRLNFDLHIGAAPIFLIETQFIFSNTIVSPKKWFWSVGFSAGTAFQIYMYKKLYLEINVDHIVPFRKDFPKYILQPSVSIGWEF